MNGAKGKKSRPARRKNNTASPTAKARALSTVSQLCPQCGLCCNGAIFEDVELRPTDNQRLLARLGFELWKKGRKSCFSQPCQAFDGSLCRVYESRPGHCRAFACRLLLKVRHGGMTTATALKTIREAKRLQKKVERLTAKLELSRTGLPLMKRYARAMAQPIDLSLPGAQSQTHSQLLEAMDRLMSFLNRHILD